MYVFDPAARGRLGVAVFAAAAAENGWAVFCSYGSRNGSYQLNFEVAQRLIDETFRKYPLDNENIYTAGFSGGARLAGAIAVLSGSIRGVIGCGASFSQNTGHFPAPGANFVWAGIVGNKDMNYQELLQAEGWLNSISVPNRLFFFDGRHRWPPQDAILRAMRYLKHATDASADPAMATQRQAALDRELSLADSLEAANDYLGAVRTLRGVQADYPAARLPEDLARRTHSLATSTEYIKQQRTWEKVTEIEESIWATYREKFQNARKSDKANPDAKWWKKQREQLRQRYKESGDPYLVNMAARLENRLFAMIVETSDPWKVPGLAKAYAYCSELLTLFFPDSGYSWIRLAEARMLQDAPNEAINALQKAKELGMGPAARIRANPLFAGILDHPQFPFPLK
ncbi:hypothetical protein [Robiginitalea myxolifaciens]|uniref:hypothetical protein n=1 Tax=Robiginitalea myxolifaciens TaxID=400055 RepID=UPI0011607214|nr:hypothetical protein [Robiginitalea myxolifaciens]